MKDMKRWIIINVVREMKEMKRWIIINVSERDEGDEEMNYYKC